MEHLLVVLVEFARWLDRRFLKPLQRAVPDLDQLLRDPRGTLASQPITIGPARRYGTGFFLGLLIALITNGLILAAFLVLGGKGLNQPALLIPMIVLMVLVLVGSIALVLHLVRGGRMVLTPAGVEMSFHQWVVSCPWSLFHAAGQPFLPRPDLMLLPVAATAIPQVEARANETLQATGQAIKTRPLSFKSATEAALRPLYEVRLDELGGLLLQLGRALGQAAPESTNGSAALLAAAESSVPPAVPDKDGWLMVRLTRLVFPPFCCDCGTATTRLQEFRGYVPLVRLGWFKLDGTESATCRVPVCDACNNEFKRRYWKAVFRSIAIGLAIPLLLSGLLALAFHNAALLLMIIPLGILGFLIGLYVGQSSGNRQAPPVQLERYAPTKGTIAIRFRWPEYGERLLAFLEAQEEYPAVLGAGGPVAARSSRY